MLLRVRVDYGSGRSVCWLLLLLLLLLQVYYGTWHGQAVAIKVLNPQSADSAKLMSEFNREVSTMTRLPEHPNVLKLLGVCTTPPNLALVTT